MFSRKNIGGHENALLLKMYKMLYFYFHTVHEHIPGTVDVLPEDIIGGGNTNEALLTLGTLVESCLRPWRWSNQSGVL